MSTVKLVQGIKCVNCGEVFVHEVTVRSDREISFSLTCPGGHLATTSEGGVEVVELRDYDQSKLRKVVFPAPH